MRRKVLKGVLGNLLGTFVSQYTRWNGQLLFGCVVEGLGEVEFDLLSESPVQPPGPLAEAERIARMRFAEQLRKAGLDRSVVHEARLRMERSAEMVASHGYRVRFRASAVTDIGRRYESEKSELIWPTMPRSDAYRVP